MQSVTLFPSYSAKSSASRISDLFFVVIMSVRLFHFVYLYSGVIVLQHRKVSEKFPHMQEESEEIYAPIKGRAYNYLIENGISIGDFCRKVGMSTSAFRGKDRKSELGGAVISRIIAEYPAIPVDWLLTGTSSHSSSTSSNSTLSGFPRRPPSNEEADRFGLQLVIEEKEKTIQNLQRMVSLLEEQIKTKDIQLTALIQAFQPPKII